jgi:hypothetical protein
MLDEDVPVAALQGVAVAQPQQLGGPRGLPASNVHEQEQALQEPVYLLQVLRDGALLPEHLVRQPDLADL